MCDTFSTNTSALHDVDIDPVVNLGTLLADSKDRMTGVIIVPKTGTAYISLKPSTPASALVYSIPPVEVGQFVRLKMTGNTLNNVTVFGGTANIIPQFVG